MSFVLLSFQSCCKAILPKSNNQADICLDHFWRSFLIFCPPSLLLISSFHLESTTFDLGDFLKIAHKYFYIMYQTFFLSWRLLPLPPFPYSVATLLKFCSLLQGTRFNFHILIPFPHPHPNPHIAFAFAVSASILIENLGKLFL